MEEFIERIVKTLEDNGFPQKKVSLPLEKMYEAADNRGLSFNKVLEAMKENRQIEGEVGVEKIVFSKAVEQNDLFKQAQEMMSQMDPEELRKMQEAVMSMSEDEKAELMKKGKDMGLL